MSSKSTVTKKNTKLQQSMKRIKSMNLLCAVWTKTIESRVLLGGEPQSMRSSQRETLQAKYLNARNDSFHSSFFDSVILERVLLLGEKKTKIVETTEIIKNKNLKESMVEMILTSKTVEVIIDPLEAEFRSRFLTRDNHP